MKMYSSRERVQPPLCTYIPLKLGLVGIVMVFAFQLIQNYIAIDQLRFVFRYTY